jgi:hypothetical protein
VRTLGSRVEIYQTLLHRATCDDDPFRCTPPDRGINLAEPDTPCNITTQKFLAFFGTEINPVIWHVSGTIGQVKREPDMT